MLNIFSNFFFQALDLELLDDYLLLQSFKMNLFLLSLQFDRYVRMEWKWYEFFAAVSTNVQNIAQILFVVASSSFFLMMR